MSADHPADHPERLYRWIVVSWVAAAILTLIVTDVGAVLTATWTDNTMGEGSTRLERKANGPTTFSSYSAVGDAAPGVTLFEDPAPQPGETYCYRAFAYVNSEISPYSNEACATVPTPPPPPADTQSPQIIWGAKQPIKNKIRQPITVTDDSLVASVEVRVDDVIARSITLLDGRASVDATVDLTPGDLKRGGALVRVTARDKAGNLTVEERNVTK